MAKANPVLPTNDRTSIESVSTFVDSISDPTPPGSTTRTTATLVFAILTVILLPTLGYEIAKRISVPAWASPYDGCGRLWLLGSFLTTFFITKNVMKEILSSEKYNQVRGNQIFVRCTSYIQHVSLLALGISIVLTFFIPAQYNPILIMKVLGMTVAASMFFLDWIILALVKHDKHLRKEFHSTVWFVDLPTFSAITFVVAIYCAYQYILPSHALSNNNDTDIFLMGLSSGAVAVELWFANLLFFLVFRDDTSVS
jgi:hypothetical protein